MRIDVTVGIPQLRHEFCRCIAQMQRHGTIACFPYQVDCRIYPHISGIALGTCCQIYVNKNKMFKEIARIMMNSVLGKVLTDKTDFKASVAQSGQYYIVTLLPQKKEMKQMFTSILLHYDTKLKLVTKVEMHEKNGDSTLIELQDIKKNVTVNASLFKIS